MPRLLAILALALGASGCTCDDGAAPRSPAPIEIAPLDAEPGLGAVPLVVRGLDAERAVAITFDPVLDVTRVALVHGDTPSWSRALPCDPARAGIVDASADDDLVVVRCPVGPAPGVVATIALATESGGLRWSAESGGAGELRIGDLTTLRSAGLVIGVGGPAGLEARDPVTGEQRWARGGSFYRVAVIKDAVLALGRAGDLFVDAPSGELLRALPGRVVGAFDGGVCVLGTRGLEWIGRRETRTLVREAAIATLIEAGMRPEEWGLRIECGRRGRSTVVLADAGPHNLIARVDPDGTVRIVRLPRTSGPPMVEGWGRELPRHVTVATEPRTVVVVDLDEARIAWTLDVPRARDGERHGEMLVVRARLGDRFVLSNDEQLVAIDGATGTIAVDERARADTLWWLDLDRAVAGTRCGRRARRTVRRGSSGRRSRSTMRRRATGRRVACSRPRRRSERGAGVNAVPARSVRATLGG